MRRFSAGAPDGFGLVNPLAVKKQIEGQVTRFYNDAVRQETTMSAERISLTYKYSSHSSCGILWFVERRLKPCSRNFC